MSPADHSRETPTLEALEQRLLLATYYVPETIPNDYSVDVTNDLQAYFDSVPDNSTIEFPSLSYTPYDPETQTGTGYRIDGTLTISDRDGLIFEGNDAHFRAVDPIDPEQNPILAYDRDQWEITGSSTDITLRYLVTYGAHPNAGKDGDYDAQREGQNAYVIGGNAQNVVVEYCEAYDTYGDGLYVGGSPDGVTVQHCHVERTGRQGMAPCQGSNILIYDNFIDDGRRAIIDIEPYAAGWSIDNIRVIGNTLGSSRLLAFAMGGGGSYGSVYIADNVALGSNGVPKIKFTHTSSEVTRRGPFIVVNNQFAVGGSSAPGFQIGQTDATFFVSNSATFPLSRLMDAVQLSVSRGSIVGNNTRGGSPSSRSPSLRATRPATMRRSPTTTPPLQTGR
jgi:hypothetical protein